jgi:hypothetical protein
MFFAGTITSASIQTDAADATRNYNFQILVNGVVVATLTLNNVIGNDTCTSPLSVAVACGDVITTFLVRTAGAGVSTFQNESAMVGVS